MEETETEKLLITKSQYHALNEIRGLEQSAFYLVIGAKQTPKGYVLEGCPEAFDHLASDVSDEIYYELSPKSQLKALRTLLCRLQPEGDF
jgi:hypothetical protein